MILSFADAGNTTIRSSAIGVELGASHTRIPSGKVLIRYGDLVRSGLPGTKLWLGCGSLGSAKCSAWQFATTTTGTLSPHLRHSTTFPPNYVNLPWPRFKSSVSRCVRRLRRCNCRKGLSSISAAVSGVGNQSVVPGTMSPQYNTMQLVDRAAGTLQPSNHFCARPAAVDYLTNIELERHVPTCAAHRPYFPVDGAAGIDAGRSIDEHEQR